MQFDVHLYHVMRAKFTGIEAPSHEAAIIAVRALPMSMAVENEDAEEVVGWLVDVVGDEEHSQTIGFEADGKTRDNAKRTPPEGEWSELEFTRARYGTKWCLAQRLTPNLKAKGYEVAISQKKYEALRRDWQAQHPLIVMLERTMPPDMPYRQFYIDSAIRNLSMIRKEDYA